MYILAISAAGEVSTKDDANIWHKGKDASCRWRYNQVHLFLPRACCHYSFLSHANVQISLLLVKAHSDREDAVPILKTQRVWEHSANGVEALSHGRDPAPRDPISPSPHSGPSLAFFWFLGKLVESMNGCGGGWAGGFGGGWLGGCRDTWAARRPGCCWSASPKAARCLVPAGLAWPLLLGQLRRCRRGFWDSLERKKLPSHLFLIISIFHNYPNDIDREACAIARGVWANLVFLGLPRKGRLCAAPGLPSTALLRGTDQPLLCSDT